MTASRPEPAAARGGPRAALAGLCAGALLALAACAAPPAAAPIGSPLAPLPTLARPLPDPLDRAAHDAAAAAIAGELGPAHAARERLERLEADRPGARPSGLVPVATLVATPDEAAWRGAVRAALERGGLEPALRAELEAGLADGPRELARAREGDARRARFAGLFNAVSEPLGRSLLGLALAPYRVGRSMLHLLLIERQREALSLQERQALVHWRRWLELHPDDPEAARVARNVERLQARWYRARRTRMVRSAEQALEAEEPRLAFVLAERALRYAPEDADATALRERAEAALAREREDLARSLAAPEAPPTDLGDPRARALAVALLLPDADVAAAAAPLRDDLRPAISDPATYALATAELRAGHETRAWRDLEALARRDPSESPASRHAAALVGSPVQHPYGAWRATRRALRRQRAAWLLQGRLAGDRPGRLFPRPLGWGVDLVFGVEAVLGLPNRLLRLPWAPISDAPAAPPARSYLARYSAGEHANDVRRWLIDFEDDRGNAFGAWRIASAAPDWPQQDLERLRQRAALQALGAARRERRADARLALLRQVGSEFPDTVGGRMAADLVREERETLTPQQIRISRGFLEENPEVAGSHGLALRSELLDGDPSNGELHPDGVRLLGGRTIEVALVDRSGDPDAAPRRVRRRVSAERLARLVARLDESARRNALVDSYAPLDPDADRDQFFDRARLGVADRLDPRATSRSTYAFVSARERYGMVRQRQSVLPVELVIQGSLPDLGLGAFPRIPPPRPTPDAVLYR